MTSEDKNADNTAKKQQIGIPFKPGESGNPDGRPKGSKNYLTLLEEALEKQAKVEGKTYWEKLAQWSFSKPMVATSILKKYIPDKTSNEITMPEGIEIVIHRSDES